MVFRSFAKLIRINVFAILEALFLDFVSFDNRKKVEWKNVCAKKKRGKTFRSCCFIYISFAFVCLSFHCYGNLAFHLCLTFNLKHFAIESIMLQHFDFAYILYVCLRAVRGAIYAAVGALVMNTFNDNLYIYIYILLIFVGQSGWVKIIYYLFYSKARHRCIFRTKPLGRGTEIRQRKRGTKKQQQRINSDFVDKFAAESQVLATHTYEKRWLASSYNNLLPYNWLLFESMWRNVSLYFSLCLMRLCVCVCASLLNM